MILRDVAAVLGVGSAWIAVSPTRAVTRWVAIWQALAASAALAMHLRGRVAWELDVRRSAYLASVARGVALDRGVSLWLGASMLMLALCAMRWRPAPAPRMIRASAAATAALFWAASWWLRGG